MVFQFYTDISIKLNDEGTLFHLYFDILFSQTLFKTLHILLAFNMLYM